MVREAVTDLLTEIARDAPDLGSAIRHWTAALGDGDPVALFEAPTRYPFLHLPWWVESSLGADHDLHFQRGLVRSSVAGYWYYRLIDDLMDGHGGAPALLAGCGPLFHAFEAPYRERFAPAAPFWACYRTFVSEAAEAAYTEAAAAEPTMDESTFRAVAARKVAAGKIPVAAVLHHMDQTAHLDRWMAACDLLGRHEQMFDDVTDWQRDLAAGRSSRLLVEAAAHAPDRDSAVVWILAEGIAWAFGRMAAVRVELRQLAAELHATDLAAFLDQREALITAWSAEWGPALSTLTRLGRAFATPASSRRLTPTTETSR